MGFGVRRLQGITVHSWNPSAVGPRPVRQHRRGLCLSESGPDGPAEEHDVSLPGGGGMKG